MKLWIDAQLPPALAGWLATRFGVDAEPVRDLGLLGSKDETIFRAAGMQAAVVLTEDSDFVHLLERHGPPPSVVWITLGNTSNARLRALLEVAWPQAQALLERGEPLVEITGRQP